MGLTRNRLIGLASVIFVVGFLALVLAMSAWATITQTSQVKMLATSGTLAPKGKAYVKLTAYLATRDAASTRPQKKAAPVGKVNVQFPTGTVINGASTVGCNQSEFSAPSILASRCSASVVGSGWALINTGTVDATARDQIVGSPPACSPSDSTQYSRTWPSGTLTCVPIGALWVRVTAYQGGVLKNPIWKTIPGAHFNTFSKSTIILANNNSLAPLAFGGSIYNGKLTVLIPSLNGSGAGAGELIGGWVVSDFFLRLSKTNYLRSPACPSTHRWSVKTTTYYSKLKGETALPSPSSITTNTLSACRV